VVDAAFLGDAEHLGQPPGGEAHGDTVVESDPGYETPLGDEVGSVAAGFTSASATGPSRC
jgi:hypothetical protein